MLKDPPFFLLLLLHEDAAKWRRPEVFLQKSPPWIADLTTE